MAIAVDRKVFEGLAWKPSNVPDQWEHVGEIISADKLEVLGWIAEQMDSGHLVVVRLAQRFTEQRP